MQDKPKYLQFLSDILLLYFLPTFPSNMLLHGSLSRSLNTNELTELRLFIWNALMCSITPVKSCMQVIVSTLEAISDETIFNEGVNMFLSSVEFTTKWNDLFSNYLCEELLCLMYHVGFKGKELLLQMLCNFLENVDQKFSKFHEVCNSIILAISHEQLFTQTEFNILKNINVKTAELLQTQLIFLFIVSKINFTVVEGLVDGAQKDSKRLPAVASLLRTGIGNEVLCKAVNIAWLFLTYFKADEQCGENELTTDLLLCTCKALDEKKNEKAIDVFIHCINIFLSRILQSPNQNNVVLDSFQPFLEKYKKNSAAMMAINKLEIVSILQQAETSNKPPSLGIMDKQSVAMYCMYCMDRIRFIEDNNKRKKLLHFLSSIAFNFHEDIFHEINKVTSIDQTKKDLFIDLIIKDNELVNYSTVVDSDVFPMIRRIEDLRALAFDEINAASKKKKDKKSKQMSSGVAGGELRLNEEMSRIDNLRLKLNKEAERYQRKWKKFDGYIGYVVEGIPTHWYIDSKEIHGKKILLKGNCLFDIHKDATTSSSSLRKQETLITESEFFMKRKSINNNVFLQHYDTTIDDLPQQVQQTVFETTCELVTLKAFLKIKDFRNPWTLSGCFKLYENIIMFTETTENSSSIIQTFHTQTVFDVFPRRYLMKHTGIEIFFKDGTSLYILFQSKKTMSKALQLVRKASGLPDFNLENSLQRHTKRWQNGEITNFDYLMILNRYSSRSYHDLTQYPVFPWILQDYTKDRIDLTDPKSFRDLGKPIPCINPERACDYVFFFLIRCEPFTTMFLNMNSGHYDKPERMFYSIEHTWKTCMNSAQCNIELIPEFFYLPDFLSNDNGFSFGCLPDSNTPISSVELPPWAEDQHDFIEIHRAALESPYVTLNAKNLYYPTSYIENYDPSTLTQEESDLFLQRLMLSGQCPIQLFTKPHPTRQFYSTTLFSFSTDKNLLPVVLDCTRYGNETIALSEGNTHRIITDGSNKAKITTTQLCMPSHITCRKGLSVISSDGKYSIIASQEDNNLHFFHNETGKEYQNLRQRTFLKLGRASVISSHIGNPNVCCFDPRTRFLITICDQNKVVCTRLDTMKTHWSFICEDRVKSVCIYNSSLYFVHDNNVCVYSLTAKLLKKHDYIANFILPMFNMQYICCIGNKKIIFCSHLSMKQISSDSGTLRNDEVVFALSLSKEIWLFTKQGNLHRYLQLPPTSLQ
ncbi:Beige/BEACH domain containing protein [Entamoeba marina]